MGRSPIVARCLFVSVEDGPFNAKNRMQSAFDLAAPLAYGFGVVVVFLLGGIFGALVHSRN